MSGWVKDPRKKQLNRIEIHENNSEFELEIEDNEMGESRTLNDVFYPPRTTTPLCFNIPALENVILELKPQYAHMTPKFTGIEDACLCLRNFEEVCSMMNYPNVPIDTIQLKFIPFALKDDDKK